MDQSEIDELLAAAQQQAEDESSSAGEEGAGPDDAADAGDSASELLDDAAANLEAAMDSGESGSPQPSQSQPQPYQFNAFPSASETPADKAALQALQDVELDLRVELGRTELLIDEVLKLKSGSVVPLDKLAGDPVDVFVNGRLVARGEVLVLNDNFCVRIAEILAPEN